MKAYKGFNANMTCRDFQYKEGETYKTKDAKVCECGFHACEHPLDCLSYYEPNTVATYRFRLDYEIGAPMFTRQNVMAVIDRIQNLFRHVTKGNY